MSASGVPRARPTIDIRPAAQRAEEGEVRAALVIERNVLEWRCDPTSNARLPQATVVIGGYHALAADGTLV